ncbi:MAG: hypothetical protein J6W29_02105 [Neisseriaceae bacterium]|nr:hypothetical protein [Neisseriaceae bacterium]
MNFSVNDYLMLGVLIDTAITAWLGCKSSYYRDCVAKCVEKNDEVNQQKYQRWEDITLLATFLFSGLGVWLFLMSL